MAAPEARNLNVSAKGGKRLALVIGNDSYRKVEPLRNARTDARAMAKALGDVGFAVTLQLDADDKALKGAIRRFKAQVGGGDEVVFYFAGHGVQLGGANYLLPIDIAGDSQEQVKDESLPLQRVLDDLQDQKARFSLAIVDACRNNPFKGSGRSIGSRGLAPTSAATGQMVLFAAGANQQALDRVGPNDRDPNGLFTRVLLKEMQKPGVPVSEVLRNVREEVVEKARGIGHEQVPALYDQSLGRFYFRPGEAQLAQLGGGSAGRGRTTAQIEDELWDAIKDSDKAGVFEEYLRQYPNGRYVAVAKVKLMELRAGPAPARPAAQANTQVAGSPADVTTPGTVFRDCAECPEMVVIPGGIAIGRTEVTQGQWRVVMGNNPSNFSSCGDTCPVEKVSWDDAQEYVRKLSQKTGKTYRLPTETEWERACRAGSQQEYCGSDNIDSVAWYDGNSGSKTHAVAGKQANAWGLNDMSGNVWEWTDSCYDSDCSKRVLRGGSWNYNP